jgi:hypothetical protein
VQELASLGDGTAVLPTADEPAHAVHRRLVQPALAPGVVSALEPAIRASVRVRLARLLAQGGGDWVAAVAEPLPSELVSLLLGLPEADLPRILRWAMSGGAILAGAVRPRELAALAAETGEQAAYLAGHFAARERAGDSTPLVAALRSGVARGALTHGQAIGIGITVMGAGGESTACLLGSAARLVASDMELQRTLRADPTLLPAFVEECVRLESPFKGHYRLARRATRIGGVALRAGDRAFLLWSSANRDEKRFHRPDAIDLARPHPRDHLGFGRGLHFCVGAPLARLEGRVALEELLSATREVALDGARPPRHHPNLFVRRLERLLLRLVPA